MIAEHADGCAWVGKFSQIGVHEKKEVNFRDHAAGSASPVFPVEQNADLNIDRMSFQCQHRIESCQNARVGCPFSGLVSATEAHQPTCIYRKVDCSRRIPWTVSVRDTQSGACTDQTDLDDSLLDVPDPDAPHKQASSGVKQTCKASYLFLDKSDHDDLECKSYCCRFNPEGCRVSGKKHDVEQHEATYCGPLHARLAKLESVVQKDVLIDEGRRVERKVDEQVDKSVRPHATRTKSANINLVMLKPC